MLNCPVCSNQIERYPCVFCGYDKDFESNPHYLISGQSLKEGKYLISKVVGAGGFGVTYSAWDTVLKRKVAIKEYMPGEFSTRMPGSTSLTVYSGEKEQQFRDGLVKFYDESVRLATFSEVPGIVQIYDCFYENETAYIVMEYLEGETLEERLKREGKIPVDEAVGIISSILEALETVHKEGMLHRDIAPNNIFLTESGAVKLLDFGAARSATGSHSKSLTVLYKEGYTAEEQYHTDGNQGTWTDVYSAAATLYKAITGKVPEGALERRVNDELRNVGKCGVRVPGYVAKAIMNALNVLPERRTKTAGEFREELSGKGKVRSRFARTKEKRIGHIPAGVFVISGLAVAAAVVLIVLYNTGIIHFNAESLNDLFVQKGKVRMVNLVNMDVSEARELLEEKGLSLEIESYKFSNDIQPGRIVSQSISKGIALDPSTSVLVEVSRGADEVQLPIMEGRQWEEVRDELDDLCIFYKTEMKENYYKPGTVINTTPKSGDWMTQGHQIYVEISSGLFADTEEEYTVDNLAGLDMSEARTLLGENGVYMEIRDYVYDNGVRAGRILSQDIKANTVIPQGSTVNVDVSLGRQIEDIDEIIITDWHTEFFPVDSPVYLGNLHLYYDVWVPKGTVMGGDGGWCKYPYYIDDEFAKRDYLEMEIEMHGVSSIEKEEYYRPVHCHTKVLISRDDFSLKIYFTHVIKDSDDKLMGYAFFPLRLSDYIEN